jgi:fructose-1,6-bisphosphatase/inositol monophosphatase family enzyme
MEGNQISNINTSKYLSVAISVAEASGTIIRKIYESGDLKTKDKDGLGDPVTIADLTVQKTIQDNFKSFFPNLITQGEES